MCIFIWKPIDPQEGILLSRQDGKWELQDGKWEFPPQIVWFGNIYKLIRA